MSKIFFGFLIGLTISLGVGIASKCQAEEWNTTDKILLGSLITLTVVDTLQTIEIKRHPEKWRELNPMIGDPPNMEKLAALKLLEAGVGYYIMNKYPESRRGVLLIMNAFYLSLVANNYSIGIRVQF